ncbi:MAG: glycosidase related protein, partial [Neobacillus sp.]|nr:glycosidase related protein [Neobacillus sp.]
MKLKKYENNPILSPMAGHDWENLAVCNPGMWYEEGVFNLLYRAAGDDEEHRIYFGLAKSKDGFHFERVSDQPNVAPLEGNYDAGCIEDPRIIKFEDTYYITYAYRPFAPGRYWTFGHDEVLVPDVPQGAPDYVKKNTANTGLLMTKDLKNYQRLGRITKTFLDDRDVIIFPEKINGKYVMIHRPKEWIGDEYDCEFPGIWISYS